MFTCVKILMCDNIQIKLFVATELCGSRHLLKRLRRLRDTCVCLQPGGAVLAANEATLYAAHCQKYCYT